MFNALTGLALGVVIFAVIIGVGSIVLQNFGNAVGGTANTTSVYLLGQLGQSGLAGWAPSVIALAIGLLFIGAFMGKGAMGRKV